MQADLSKLNVTQLEILTGRDRRWITRRLAEAQVEADTSTKRERWFPARLALEAIYAVADGLDLNAERARLAKEQADAQELKNAELRGELIRGDAVENWLVRLLGAVTQRIRSIPPKAAPESRATASDAEAEAVLAGFHDEALAEIADAMRDAAGVVAGLRSRALAAGNGGGFGGGETATAGDGESVGGPRAKAKSGIERGAGSVEDGEG